MNDDYNEIFKNMQSVDYNSLVSMYIRRLERDVLLRLRKRIDTMIDAQGVDDSDDLNPYKILGVSETANQEEVKSAYRIKVNEHHPDKGGSNEEFIRIQAAYEVICKVRGWSK